MEGQGLGPGLRKLALKRETDEVPRHDPQKLRSEELPREARQPSPPGSSALPVAEQSPGAPARAAHSGPFLEGGLLLPHQRRSGPREAPAGASAGGLCGARRGGPGEGRPPHCTQEPPGAHPATLLQAHGHPPPLPAPHPPRPAPAEGLYWAQFPTRLSPQEAHCRGNGWACVPVQGSAEGSAGMSTPLSAWFQTVPWAPLGCAPPTSLPQNRPSGREGGGHHTTLSGIYVNMHKKEKSAKEWR